MFQLITCFGINIKVCPMRFQHLEGQLAIRGRVHVCGRNLNHRFHFGHVLLDGRKIHRLGKFWSVIVNVHDFQVDVSPGDQRLSSQVGGVD